RAAGEEDVVHQDDGLVLDRERDVGATDHGRAAQVEVVAVERDVERAHGQRGAVDARDLGGQPLGEGDAAGAEPDEREILRAGVPLEDLVRDAGQRTIEGPIVENLGFLSGARRRVRTHRLSLRASRGPLKGRTLRRPHDTWGTRSRQYARAGVRGRWRG